MNKNTTTSTENLYHLNGKISVKQAIPFGLQHILAMFVANLTPITIIAGAGGLKQAEIAMLKRTDMPEEELKCVARALLPAEIMEGTELHYEMMCYTIKD